MASTAPSRPVVEKEHAKAPSSTHVIRGRPQPALLRRSTKSKARDCFPTLTQPDLAPAPCSAKAARQNKPNQPTNRCAFTPLTRLGHTVKGQQR